MVKFLRSLESPLLSFPPEFTLVETGAGMAAWDAFYEFVNIGGNKVRLITAIHYNQRMIYIRHVLTHQEYERGKGRK